jgi:hypothetical protein
MMVASEISAKIYYFNYDLKTARFKIWLSSISICVTIILPNIE